MNKIDYFDGAEWFKVDLEEVKTWFGCEVNLDMIEDIMEHGTNYIKVNFKDGDTLYFKNVYGIYADPVRVI